MAYSRAWPLPLRLVGKVREEVVLDVSLYPVDLNLPYVKQSVSERLPLRVTFKGARAIEFKCDMSDLAFNSVFGNTNRMRCRKLKTGQSASPSECSGAKSH